MWCWYIMYTIVNPINLIWILVCTDKLYEQYFLKNLHESQKPRRRIYRRRNDNAVTAAPK